MTIDSAHELKLLRSQSAEQAERIAVLTRALEYYRDAWVDDFNFLGTEPVDRIPSDSLTDDRGNRARAALSLGRSLKELK